jgi:formylglycine-generating enzyme required for sulfatase activity/serine/threonine protein kinase
MNTIATCPSREDLELLFAGQRPLPQVEQLAGHLESCQACARAVETLPALVAPAGDTLADALLRQSANASGPLEPDLVRIMERLRQLRTPAGGADSSGTAETIAPETGVSTPTGGVAAAAQDVSYDFLAPPQSPDEIGRLGPYRILQVLGQGGMGMVFKAEDPRLDRLCALKTMLPEIARKPEMKERFLREAKAAAKIEHDNIIPIFQVDEAGGVPYIAMPFLKGASLEDYLKQKEKGRAGAALTVPQIIKIGREIARGLAAAHERGMIHRDIKPANVWLDGSANGRVKILDFGLARLSQGTGEQNLTQSGAIMGTPSYMAPEQAQAQKLDGRADLFSLGVILYRMCTGELPFKGNDPISTLMSLAMHNPPPPSQLNPAVPFALSDLVMRLLAKDATERTASADALLKELQDVAAGLSAPASASTTTASASMASDSPALVTGPAADPQMRTSSFAPASVAAQFKRARPLLRRPAGVAAVAAGLLAAIAVATVYWIQTPAGIIRVEITDPQVEVAIKGTEMKFTGADPQPVSVKPGEGEKVLVVTRGDFTFETDKLVLKKGDDTTVKVELLDGVVRVTADGESIGSKALTAPQVAANASPAGYAWPSDAPPPAIAPFDAAQAKAHQEAWAKHLGVPVEYTNSIGMKFRLIPPGGFLMGSTTAEMSAALNGPGNDEDWRDNIRSESPQRKTILASAIYLAVHEVTQSQYEKVMGQKPAHFSATGKGKDQVANLDTRNFPVEMTNWNDAIEFCGKLAQLEGRSPNYAGESVSIQARSGYRLPTEAEWEFACRAGTTTRYSSGDTDKDLFSVGWVRMNAEGRTHAVGELKANPFGLQDMHGNVWEWTEDWRHAAAKASNREPDKGQHRDNLAGMPHIVRGGHWGNFPLNCRSATRFAMAPTLRFTNIGFRVAVTVEAVKAAMAKLDSSTAIATTEWHGWPADGPAPAIAPFDAAQAKAHQEAWAKHLGVPVEYTNSIGMKFRLIPAGEFMMGSTPEEIENALLLTVNDEVWQLARRSEGPRHLVRLTRPVYMGVYEVTQSQFAEVVGRTPSQFASGGSGNDIVADVDTRNHPVEMVTWDDALEFCGKLRDRERRPGGDQAELPGGHYRLPTEAEWEFACRAGTTTEYWSGNKDTDVAQSDWIAPNADGSTHAVGQRKSNPFGLFDAHGNVSEWVQDWWDPLYYGQFAGQTAIDPSGPTSPAVRRVLRGGAWHADGHRGRAAVRHAMQPSNRSKDCGFRVALDIDVAGLFPSDPAETDLALDFDGQPNWVHIPTLSTDGTHPLTVECWIHPRRIEGNQPAIKMAGPGSVGVHIGQDHIVANCFLGGGAHGVRLAAADKRDLWSHVACVWDGAEFRLYLDGRRCGESFPTKAKPHDPRMTMLGGCPSALNVLTSEADYFDGMLNEIRFSRVARYADDFTPEARFAPDADTLALYHCDEGAGEVLNDSSGNGHQGKIVAAKWVASGPLAAPNSGYAWPADAPPPAIAPFEAAQAKAHQEDWTKHLGVPVEYTNRIGMKFRLIPPGEFLMGSTPEEIEAALPIVGVDSTWQECVRAEGPQHRVVLARPYYLGVHEVTQQQYETVMGANPATFSATGAAKDAVAGKSTALHPVETVSWNDACEFCARLSAMEKLAPRYARSGEAIARLDGNGYRLPTEAEWEYACRAGTTTRFWCGDDDEGLLQVAWFDRNAAGLTNAVGQLRANPFGLFDVHGNVWEFVQDGWDPAYYQKFGDEAAVDPDNPGAAGAAKVVRGGRGKTAASSRSAGRYFQSATNSHAFIGFRVVLPVDAVRPPAKD